MSTFIKNVTDPFGVLWNKKEEPKPAPSRSDSGSAGGEGVMSDAEAADIARKRLFRSGTVYTSTLGEEIDPNSLSGTRLQ